MEENKKVVKTVKDMVSKSVKGLSILKTKGENVVSKVKKEWKDSEPKRQELGEKTKNIIKKIGKGSKEVFNKSVQLEKDIEKGVKLGLKK